MKNRKEPKSFNKPRLYLQLGNREIEERIRIIYPNGMCEWLNHFNAHMIYDINPDYNRSFAPCWAKAKFNINTVYEPMFFGFNKSAAQALKLMHEFDEGFNFPRAIFLGEL